MVTMRTESCNDKKILVIYPDKYLTVNQVWPIQSCIEKDQCGHCLRVILNLKNVMYIDSTGFGLLCVVAKNLEKKGCELVICECSLYITALIHKMNFGRLFKIYPEEKEALLL